jgi:hypothetical protein
VTHDDICIVTRSPRLPSPEALLRFQPSRLLLGGREEDLKRRLNFPPKGIRVLLPLLRLGVAVQVDPFESKGLTSGAFKLRVSCIHLVQPPDTTCTVMHRA